MNNKANFFLPDFSDLHIMVIGDIMIDRYISGSVRRISPEAPVPVLELQDTEDRLGGAANVALNLQSLGAQVTLLSIIGADDEGENLATKLDTITNLEHHLVRVNKRQTTVKTRVISGKQQIVRIDKEDTNDISEEVSDMVFRRFEKCLSQNPPHGIIIQDYNKGMLVESLIKKIIESASQAGIATFVDPKEKNFFAYEGCTLFKPNKKEVQNALGIISYDEADRILRQKLGHKITFITLGGDGIYINDGIIGHQYPTKSRTITDVCGAGDSVISIAALCYLKKMPMDYLALAANTAGGQVCQKPGVVSIDLNELNTELSQTII